MPADPHMQRLQPEIQQECVERGGNRSEVAHQMGGALGDVRKLAERLRVRKAVIRLVRLDKAGELVGMLLPVEVSAVDDASAHLRGVSVHVLGGGVRHDVAPEIERAAEDRGRERVVDDQRYAVLVRDLRELGDVEHHAGRVCDGLTEYALGVRTERLLYLRGGCIRIDEREFDSELLEGYRKEIERTAVYLRGGDHMVAGVADVEDGKCGRRLSGRGEDGCHSAFEGGDLLGHLVIGRVRKTRVEIS